MSAALSSVPTSLPEFLSRRQLVAYLRSRGIPMAVSTLANRAAMGLDPPMVRFAEGGHPRYDRAAVDAWIEGRKHRPIIAKERDECPKVT